MWIRISENSTIFAKIFLFHANEVRSLFAYKDKIYDTQFNFQSEDNDGNEYLLRTKTITSSYCLKETHYYYDNLYDAE
jgi:hypothetical protein